MIYNGHNSERAAEYFKSGIVCVFEFDSNEFIPCSTPINFRIGRLIHLILKVSSFLAFNRDEFI